MAVLKILWEAGYVDECSNVVSRLLGVTVEQAYYSLVLALDEK